MNSYNTKVVKVSADIVENSLASILYWVGQVNDDQDIPFITINEKKDGLYEIVYTTKKRREAERI